MNIVEELRREALTNSLCGSLEFSEMLYKASDKIESLRNELLRLRETVAEPDVESIDRVLKENE